MTALKDVFAIIDSDGDGEFSRLDLIEASSGPGALEGRGTNLCRLTGSDAIPRSLIDEIGCGSILSV